MLKKFAMINLSVLLILTIITLTGCSDKNEETKTKETNTEVNYQVMDYKDLFRLEPNDFGKKVYIFGRVIEIEKEELKGNYDDGHYLTTLWINMLNEDGVYKSVRVIYVRQVGEPKILVGDMIDVKGYYTGEHFENLSSNEDGGVTATFFPEINADEVKIWESSL